MEVDKNNVEYLPLQAFSYKKEEVSYDPKENFRDDGSYRLDFNGERDSVCVGAYMNVAGPKDEEFAGKLLGTHSNHGKNSGSYVIGIRLDGEKVRLRKEIHGIGKVNDTGEDYTKNIKPTSLKLGDLRKKWIGLMYFKINQANGNVLCQAFVDTTGLDSDGNPRNNWQQIFECVDDGTIAKDEFKPIWLKPSQGPKKTQNTIRVDGQKKNTYDYKFAFCREIIHL